MKSAIVVFFLVYSVLSQAYRSLDGVGNNPTNPNWGSSRTLQLHKCGILFDDDIEEPVDGVNPRVISNEIFDLLNPGLWDMNERNTNVLLTYWGQLIDHDITLTKSNSSDPREISIPANDPIINSNITPSMPFFRSNHGYAEEGFRIPTNDITSFLDASFLYGATKEKSDALRLFVDGKLRYGNLLPDGVSLPQNNFSPQITGMDNPVKILENTELFAAGDIRANENPVLISLQTLWLREHNRMAEEMKRKNSGWNDEQLFQETRRHIIALYQHIVFDEYLPTLVGNKIPKYTGFKENVNPSIDVFFSTCAFRFGHSEIKSVITRMANTCEPVQQGHILLRDNFFQIHGVMETGITPILLGAILDPQDQVDGNINDDMRNFLFALIRNHAHMDIISLNIQRQRDHGIPLYNDVREAFGLERYSSFEQITDNVNMVNALKKLYGSIDEVDSFVGGIIEKNVRPDNNLGELFCESIVDQFTRIRDGDRFWYEAGDPDFVKNIKKVSLKDIIVRNTDDGIPDTLQNNVFMRSPQACADILGIGSGSSSTQTAWIIVLGSTLVVLIIAFAFYVGYGNTHLYQGQQIARRKIYKKVRK